MNLPVSKSWIEPTPANIKKIAEEFGLTNGNIPKLKRRKGESDQELYVRYIKEITDYEPCLICNGPRKRILLHERTTVKWGGKKQTWDEEWSAPKCTRYRIHDAALNFAKDEERALRILGGVCEHGFYKYECPDCTTLYNPEKNAENDPNFLSEEETKEKK